MGRFPGATLRGGFGHALKKTACAAEQQSCDKCMLQSRCVYSRIFNTPVPEDSNMMKKYPYAPHPFILHPPHASTEVAKDADFGFGITLFGSAAENWPYVIFAFRQLGRFGLGPKRVKFKICEVRQIFNTSDENRTLLRGTDEVENEPRPESVAVAPGSDTDRSSSITVHLHTPLRLKYDGKIVGKAELQFHKLLPALLRRLSALLFFHCGQELELDYASLVEWAEKDVEKKEDKTRWCELNRFSGRQKRRIKGGGLVGQVKFCGKVDRYVPFLKAGTHTAVGKWTAFGLGQYEVIM